MRMVRRGLAEGKPGREDKNDSIDQIVIVSKYETGSRELEWGMQFFKEFHEVSLICELRVELNELAVSVQR